jgi:hypothetical protein
MTIRSVERIVAGLPTSDGAGVKLTRVIGQPALRLLDPFLMLDRIHSDEPDAYLAGFPDHPHRGFETVTIMHDGRMRHRDSRGNHGLIEGGGSQWMTAAGGIIHSEMPEQERGLLSGFQLWINLPAKEKLAAPAYQDLGAAQLAEGALEGGGRLRVIAGSVDGLRGPVRERPTDPLLFTLALEGDRPVEFDVKPGHNAFVFATAGTLEVGPENRAQTVPENRIALLGPGDRVRLRAPEGRALALFAAARPLNEPVVAYGPFVMNTEAEIHQCFADYRAGRLDRAVASMGTV